MDDDKHHDTRDESGTGFDHPGTSGVRAAARVEHLQTAECWDLLQQAELGRLALVRADGEPDIFPVNFLTHEGAVFIRTARDSKLMHIAHHPVAAFEADGETDSERWSVVLRGPVSRVTDDALIRESGVQRLRSWSPSQKVFAITLAAHVVTGRRFAKSAGYADRIQEFEGSASRPPAPEPAPETRAGRPQPIPHRTPAPPEAPRPSD